MAKSLVITEKPSVARDIVAALGGFRDEDGGAYWENDQYVVTFSVGHILELQEPEDIDPQYKRWTLDTLPILPEKFKLKKKAGSTDRVRTIQKLLQRDDVTEVVNACDAGREGELIFREILEFLDCPKPVKRLWLSSMTAQAIRNGFASLEPGERYDRLGAAARCRSYSDWLIGMNATRALTRRLKSRREKAAWSAGRVQTPTLAIIVDRELEVLSHIPRPYSRIEATFEGAGQTYQGAWFDPEFRADEEHPERRDDRIFDEQRARAIAEVVQGQSGQASETRRPSKETAPPLFDLTSLQREANRRFGWSARRTLNAAQRCYEGHKVLTYPRTSSRALPAEYRSVVDELVRTLAASAPFGREARVLAEHGLENTARTFDDAKVSDHFAIIPTGRVPEAPLTGDDGKLFDVVVRRFLAAFYPPAVWTRVERITEVLEHSFRSRSRTLDDPGWRSVVGQTEQEDQVLPPLVPGQEEASGIAARTREIEAVAEKTRPPARYNEARLLSLMENAGRDIEDEDLGAGASISAAAAAEALRDKGIGTSATRADIIENLIAKGYIVRGNRALRPTVKGIRLVDVLRRIHVERLASPALTGELEHHLSEVEAGGRTQTQFMDEMVEYTKEIVGRARDFEYEDLYADEDALGSCPRCNRPVFERSWFYRCLEVPNVAPEDDCPFRLWKDKSGRYMDRETVRTLLSKGETGELEGFTARDGRIYGGILKLESGELKLEAVRGAEGDRASDAPEYEVDPEPLGPCPMGCGSEVIETPTHFVCRAGREKTEAIARQRDEVRKSGKRWKAPTDPAEMACPFVLPRTVCKREIARDEAIQYMTNKKTELLTDFTSRNQRPFAAMLFLKENGRHGFEFAPRPGRAAAAEGAAPAAEGEAAVAGGETPAPLRKARKAGTRKKAAAKARGSEGPGEPPSPNTTRVIRKRGVAARGKRKPAARKSSSKSARKG